MYAVEAKQDGKKGYMILFRCEACGHEGWNRSSPDDDVDEIIGLMMS